MLAGRLADDPDRCLGPVDDHPWLRDQQRVTFARVGVVDPASLGDYAAHGGWAGLTRALSLTQEQVVAEVTESGLRGRGGAGFPAGVKWKTVLEARRRTRSSSAATSTRVTPGPSPTGCWPRVTRSR